MTLYEVKTKVIHDTSGTFSQGEITNRPSPAITVGVNGMNSRHYQIEYYLTDSPPPLDPMPTNKPPYRVPSMKDIAAIPWNGFNVVSTFSGTGGSCLGYRMAGYRVLWANEFIPAAQESYKANHPNSILDTRDIRTVQPEDILRAIGLGVGEIDIFDGSPPCAAFSTAGKRESGWGKVKKYSDTTQRVDDLFFEYTRLIKGTQPKVFVAENVSGLIKGTAKGYFIEILKTLKDCGYNVKCKVLDAQWLGVPQMRQRTIFVGVRSDLGLEPAHPKPLPYRYSVRDALPWVTKVKIGGQPFDYRDANDRVSPTVMQSDASRSESAYLSGGGWIEAESWLNPDTLTAKLWDATESGSLSNACMSLTGKESFITHSKAGIDKPAPCVTQGVQQLYHPTEKRRFSIAELKRICGFPDDFILTGNYVQQWERLGRAVPPVMMSHIAKTIQIEILEKLCAG